MQTLEHSSDAPPAPGRDALVLDRYRLVRRLGAGGFGVVWLAHDERLDRAVAVKRIAVDDRRVAARAEREAIAAARLAHPGIVALYEAGKDAEAVYLVSELVRGRPLDRLLADGELSDRDVLEVGLALCDALAHAHGRGVVHRDVKPGNVLVPDRAHDAVPSHPAKLTDFGVARLLGDDGLTLTGDVVGTLAYMAPEQADGREVTGQADLYALALVLYEALSGVNPVRAPGAAATARRVGARMPPLGRLRRDLPLELCRAIDRAVQPRPEERGTLPELHAALAGALPGADDEPGTIAGPLLDGDAARVAAPAAPAWRERAVAGVALGLLVTAAAAWLGPAPPLPAPALGLATAVLTLLLPRGGWALAALALPLWLAAAGAPGTALVLALAAAPVPLLLPRAATLWSAPAGASLLGLAGLAAAWPALAGQARRLLARAALAALGFWWLALAELLTGDRLAIGMPAAARPRAAWEGSVPGAVQHAIWPLLSGGMLAIALLWAAGAAMLPLIVRGRAVVLDLAGAAAWAAGLASATSALAGAGGTGTMRGLTIGSVTGAALAIAARASRGST